MAACDGGNRRTLVGLETTTPMLDGPKVSDLADPPTELPATAPSAAKPCTAASEPNEVSSRAGVNHQCAAPITKWPPALGRAADLMPSTSKPWHAPGHQVPASQPNAALSRPAKNPTVTADVKTGVTDAGTLVGGTAKATYTLTQKDKISLELNEQWSSSNQPGVPDTLDHQLGASWEHLLFRASDGRFKLTSNAGAFFGVNQPLNGGDIATRFGLRGEIVGSFKPNDVVELRGSIFAQNQWFPNAGDSLFAVGGDLSAVITDPKTQITGTIGVRGEGPFKDGAATPVSGYARITVPIDERWSFHAEGFIAIKGDRGVYPSSSASRNDGGAGFSGGISVSF
jgi:hypothetical protein